MTGQGATTLRLFYSSPTVGESAVLVFQLPDLQGKAIESASLTVSATKANANNTYTQAADLYAVRCVHNTASNSDTEISTGDYQAQTAYSATNNGVGIMNDFLPKNTPTAADGPYSTDAAGGTALGAWIQAQYNAGALPGDYVFLRLNVDTNPNGSTNYNYRGWTINSGDNAANRPVLTINTVSQIDVPGSLVSWGENTAIGSVVPTSTTLRVGRVSSNLTAGVVYFDLPDLNGAAIISAKLKFKVNSANFTGTNTANLSVEAIRSSAAGGTRLTTDYQGLGLRPGEVSIQTDLAHWNDTPLPASYETSAAAGATLGNWLTAQYSSVGTGGLVFLRLAPSINPGADKYFTVAPDSVELIITTDGNVAPSRGFGNTVTAKVGNNQFSWTFDLPVQWGHFIDGQPWVVMPSGGILNLTAASPARQDNASVYTINPSNPTTTIPYTADINITVKNPPFDHTFSGTGWVDDPNGVFGWDSRAGHMQDASCSPKYSGTVGWGGVTPLLLAAGDSVTTPKSMTDSVMSSRGSMITAMGVLTVLSAVPPDDAFRPGVIRSGTDRTNPEILRYSSLISDLDAHLIANPVNVTTDLKGSMMLSIPDQYRYYQIKNLLNGAWYINTGYSTSEGVMAIQNNYGLPTTARSVMYGGNIGNYTGQVAIGCLASWLTPEQRKSCRIRYIQRAIDVYSAVKAGVCVEEGAGIEPGYSTLLTNAGVMINHVGMKSVNNGVNGVKPYWIFADYATMYHTDGVPAGDLFSGETTDRLVPLYSTGTTNYPEYNKAGILPVVASSTNTMTMRTDFRWGRTGRPIVDMLNMKVRITGGAGAGSTIYTITGAVVDGVTDAEKFRTTSNALYPGGSANCYGYVLGGKVQVKPNWQNGLPDATSVLTMSIFARDSDNPQADDAKWFFNVVGRRLPANPATLEKVNSVSTSPTAAYACIQAGATVDNLITLYALGQQSLYKGGVDKYLIKVGEIPGYGEVLFNDSYFQAVAWNGTSYNMRGALWKQVVLNPLGEVFQYTGTAGVNSLPQAHTHAKLWNEP